MDAKGSASPGGGRRGRTRLRHRVTRYAPSVVPAIAGTFRSRKPENAPGSVVNFSDIRANLRSVTDSHCGARGSSSRRRTATPSADGAACYADILRPFFGIRCPMEIHRVNALRPGLGGATGSLGNSRTGALRNAPCISESHLNEGRSGNAAHHVAEHMSATRMRSGGLDAAPTEERFRPSALEPLSATPGSRAHRNSR